MQPYEKLGAFYLGREFDPGAGRPGEGLVLYDAKDLTTHAVCVGMTGSGKTGMCVTLLEEALIDGIPALAIDPKGDLGSLLLTFPELRPEDFRPWVDEGEAARKGQTPDEYARSVAQLWTRGLADWAQDGERIRRLREAADLAIYTPGSTAGLQVSLLRSFAAPPPALLDDGDAFRDRVSSAVSGLLALLGIAADPIRSREHILLANILDRAWREGRSLDLAGLIQTIQAPPFDRVGVLDVESFFPARERAELAMTLNNLLASPGFGAWMEGEPLDVGRLLWTPEGRPRLAVLSIAHLREPERMFFVTTLLNEVVAWMRTQAGTSSLRALLYMDEVFGYLPPTANPPSKLPLLTLLKQARAYGLGVVLATQNPVDLDYKALSNAGTWFLGRLQTERDKARVLDGLEGASASATGGFDRARIETTLSGLESRVFLMHNVHEDAPVLFHTRWAMSYLRGPLTRQHVQALMEPRKRRASSAEEAAAAPGRVAPSGEPAPRGGSGAVPAAAADSTERPLVPPEIPERFLGSRAGTGDRLVYRPGLAGRARLHFVRSTLELDSWEEVESLAPLWGEVPADPWEGGEVRPSGGLALLPEPEGGVEFETPPDAALRPTEHAKWAKGLASHLYRTRSEVVLRCKNPKLVSEAGEGEGAFRARLGQLLREERDRQIEKARRRYAPKLARLQDRIRKAEARVEVQKSQYGQQKLSTAVSIGATVLGALFGRKIGSVGTVGRAGTAARSMGRAAKERGDIARASQDVEALRRQVAELEERLEEDLAGLRDSADPSLVDVESVEVRPRKSDISVLETALVWIPFRVGSTGIAEPAYRWEA